MSKIEVVSKVNPASVAHWWHRNRLDRSVIAHWRRIQRPSEAYLEPSFAAFVGDLGDKGYSSKTLERLAYSLALTSNVREDNKIMSFGQQLATVLSGSESGKLRFRKLYECGDQDLPLLFRECRRGIKRLDGICNIQSLAGLVLKWPFSRKQLAQDFFEVYKEKNHNPK